MSVNDGRILDYDPVMGITEKYYEDHDGNWVIERQQDVERIIELNKSEYNSTDERATHKSENFNRYARIPMVVLMKLERDGILRDSKAFRKWLDNPDNRFFRTRPGRLA